MGKSKTVFLLAIMTLMIPLNGLTYSSPGKIPVEKYIATYFKIAVTEMHRTGIPASITLAQGIIESGSGNSRLATEGNNHFGIKCHKGWNGPSIFEDDDEKNECFRKYASAEESYLDHSDFLMTRQRYSFLFDLKKNDYKAWAKGLKKAGYATNPKYAPILINVIEKYSLDQYDKLDKIPDEPLIVKKPEEPEKEEDDKSITPILFKPVGVFTINRIKTVILQKNSSLSNIADEYNISVKRLEKYNEILGGREIKPGMQVFLQPKRNKSEVKYHKVKKWEKMYDISQKYGIKISVLYKKNMMIMGQEPAIGQRVYLRPNRTKSPKLRDISKDIPVTIPAVSKKEIETHPSDKKEYNTDQIHQSTDTLRDDTGVMGTKPIEKVEKSMNSETSTEIKSSGSYSDSTEVKYSFKKETSSPTNNTDPDMHTEMESAKDVPVVTEASNPVYHIVSQGDTLYGLAKKFDSSVDQLKKWNNLETTGIRIGQRLIVGMGN